MGEAAFLELISLASPLAVGIGVVLLIIILGLKYSGVGMTFGNTRKLVDDAKVTAVAEGVSQIKTKLDRVEDRMQTLERDVESRATRDEVHKIELSLTRMEARFEAVDARTDATAHGVSRIESFMYEAALDARKSRREP